MSRKAKEGKTLGAPSAPCENCNETGSAYHCPQCNMDLCVRCEQFHSKSNLTKDHRVVSLAEKINVLGKTVSQTVSCDKHTGQPLQFVCESCIVSLCGICKASHRGHKIMEVDLNVGTVQRLCLQGVPELMGLLEQLNLFDDTTHPHKKIRAFVVQQRDHIQSVIKRESSRLLNDIDREIQSGDKRAKDRNDEAKRHATQAEKMIADLTEMRRVSDPNVLLGAINAYDTTTSGIKRFLTSKRDTKKRLNAEAIVPYIGLINDIEKLTKLSFTGTLARPMPASSNLDFKNLIQYFSKQFPKLDGSVYRLSECKLPDHDTIVVFGICFRDVHVVNIRTMKTNVYKCDRNIYHMITLAPGRHVITEFERAEPDRDRIGLHLLDDTFRVIYSMSESIIRPGHMPAALCVESESTFILRESPHFDRKSEHKFHRVNVVNDQFLFTAVGEIDYSVRIEYASMGYNRYNNTIMLSEIGTSVGILQLDNMKYESIVVDTAKKGLTSLCVDVCENFIGDDVGCVHVLTSEGKHRLSVQLGSWYITGIAVKGEILIIVDNRELKMYRVPKV